MAYAKQPVRVYQAQCLFNWESDWSAIRENSLAFDKMKPHVIGNLSVLPEKSNSILTFTFSYIVQSEWTCFIGLCVKLGNLAYNILG